MVVAAAQGNVAHLWLLSGRTSHGCCAAKGNVANLNKEIRHICNDRETLEFVLDVLFLLSVVVSAARSPGTWIAATASSEAEPTGPPRSLMARRSPRNPLTAAARALLPWVPGTHGTIANAPCAERSPARHLCRLTRLLQSEASIDMV